jgi:hypothetical protein
MRGGVSSVNKKLGVTLAQNFCCSVRDDFVTRFDENFDDDWDVALQKLVAAGN